jgi:hypothetical protein
MITGRSGRLRASVLAGVIALGTAALPIAGCKGGGLGGLMSSPTAMDLLAPAIKDAANAYVGNLTSLANSLGKLNSLQGVVDFVNKAQPVVKQVRSSYDTLAATSGVERANLVKAFGPKIDQANAGFLSQSQRVSGDPLWSKALEPVLSNVKLFR